MSYKLVECAEQPVLVEYNGIELFNNNSIVIDCGACVGNFTQPLWDKYHCNFHLIEPDPRNFRQLRYRFSIYNKIILLKNAISDNNNKELLYIGRFETASSLFESHRGLNKNSTIVDCIDLNEYISNFGEISLLKLDIEGTEKKVIPNLKRTILNKIKQIVVEYHLQSEIYNYTNRDVEICRNYLKDNGFKEIIYDDRYSRDKNKASYGIYLNNKYTQEKIDM